MGAFLAFPLLVVILAAYNVMAFTDLSSLGQQAFAVDMFSGAVVDLSWGDLVVLAGLMLLFIEVLKAARTASSTMLDHILSTAVFVAALVEMLLVEEAGTATFLVLVVICLIDVVAGFTVTIRTARRDLSFGQHG